MDKLKELDEQQDAICQQIENTKGFGKTALYKQLTEVLKKKQIIYKEQLERIRNEY